MVVEKIEIEDLKGYIDAAFEDDVEIVSLYDKKVKVENVDDVCQNVYEKIESLADEPELTGITLNGEKVGFIAYKKGYLISFGLNKKHREKKILDDYFEIIKQQVGSEFQVALYDYNKRAIKWLKKQRMEIIFENLTILKCQS